MSDDDFRWLLAVSVRRVFCPIHDRELDVHGCLACKAVEDNASMVGGV